MAAANAIMRASIGNDGYNKITLSGRLVVGGADPSCL
jgi:hypothetical protein